MSGTRISQAAGQQNAERSFSLLSCLFIGGAILTAEVLLDIFFYPWGSKMYPVQHMLAVVSTEPLKHLGIAPIYSYGLRWWPPVFLICFAAGRRLGRPAIVYSLCGVVLYLVIEHNFRGIMGRHNVFEWADQERHSYQPGIPDPIFWD